MVKGNTWNGIGMEVKERTLVRKDKERRQCEWKKIKLVSKSLLLIEGDDEKVKINIRPLKVTMRMFYQPHKKKVSRFR